MAEAREIYRELAAWAKGYGCVVAAICPEECPGNAGWFEPPGYKPEIRIACDDYADRADLAKAPDELVIPELATLAHECGHFVSWFFNQRTPAYERAIHEEPETWGLLSQAEKDAVRTEEAFADFVGRQLLVCRGASEDVLQVFDERAARSRRFYEDALNASP